MKLLISLALVLLISPCGYSQTASGTKGTNRVDLDDVKIKGEANKNSVSFSSRSKHDLNDRIKLRKDFNREVLENLPADFMSNN